MKNEDENIFDLLVLIMSEALLTIKIAMHFEGLWNGVLTAPI